MTKTKLNFLDTLVTIHLSADSNADELCLIEHIVPYGFSPPLHIHHTEDEVFHLLDGEARFVVGGKDIHARAGDTLVAPKGVPHSFVVTSPNGARWINVMRGADFESMVRSVSRPATGEAVSAMAMPPAPEVAAALKHACDAHHIELIGPPLALTQVLDHAYV